MGFLGRFLRRLDKGDFGWKGLDVKEGTLFYY